MKKALVILLALIVSVGAFAGDPAPELAVTKFSGDASVTLGVDLDNGAMAFSNAASASVQLDIMGGGDKATSGEGIWGELKIKTDGDPIRIKADHSGFGGLSGYKVVVDVAKLHLADMAYIGIKSGGTNLDYAGKPDLSSNFAKVDPAAYYGVAGSGLFASNGQAVGFDAGNGIELGVTLEKLLDLFVDFRTPDAWATDGSFQTKTDADKNRFGFRVKLDVKAVDNLTLQAGFSTGFGGEGRKYDLGFGGKLGYTIKLDDTYSIVPSVAIDAVQDVDGTEKLGYDLAGVLNFTWGGKGKSPNFYFDKETDAYPGFSAGVILSSKDVFNEKMSIAASLLTGSLVENLTAAVAFEMTGLEDGGSKQMGLSAVAKYSLAMDPMTVVPKFGFSYYSDEAGVTDEAKTDVYVKAGLELNKIFPNTNIAIEYASNDFVGGVNNVTTDVPKMGMLATTLKIAF